MQLGSTRPAAKKHLPEECNPTAEWHYFCTIRQAIAGAILFSPTRNRWLKWLRLHAAHDHGVWDLAGLWALMINDDQWIDHDWPWTLERMTSHTWFCKEEWLDHGHRGNKSTECKRKHRQSTKAPSDRSPAIDFDRFDRFELPAAQHLGSQFSRGHSLRD